MVRTDRDSNGNDSIIYVPLPEDEIKHKSNSLILQFKKYASEIDLKPEDVCIQRALLPRIITRVDKREGYFCVFHDNTKINEIKQAALYAYWIIKFKPFMVLSEDTDVVIKYARINEGFAYFYIMCACRKCAEIAGNKTSQASSKLMEEAMYGLTYWDLSKESLIMFAETIAESFYGIPAQGIKDMAKH